MWLHALTDALTGLIPAGYAMAAIVLACALSRRTRRLGYATYRFARAHAPKWLVPVLAVCAFIPGPVDEVLAVAVALYAALRTSRNRAIYRRYIRRALA